MPDQGTGLQKQLGPLKTWQWIVGVAALAIGYYLYRSYKNNQAATASNTGTDTTGVIDPTTGQPYAAGSTYDPYGYGYQSLQSQLTAMMYDPATGQPYYSEFATNFASLTSANTALENQIATLTSTIEAMPHTTATVPTPGATDVTPVSNPVVSSGDGGSGTSTGGGSGAASQTVIPFNPVIAQSPNNAKPLLNYLPIAQQIQMVKSGAATKNQLGPNALKIYNAGGISTALPTAAAVKEATSKGLMAGAPLGVY